MNSAVSAPQNKSIAIWLLVVAASIFCMIVLGGVTRLTNSGLSMVDWKPIMGIIPPLTDSDWQASFAKYQQFPEFQKLNSDMTLEGYQGIFIFEYLHRILGRLIGLLFLLPFLYFLFTKQIHRSDTIRFTALFILGGLQGLLGWYMVKSGLSKDPHVSQYRLTAHLGSAFLLYGYICWVAFGYLISRGPQSVSQGIKAYGFVITGLIFVMILSGGFVAGTRAGLAYNTFPLMAGHFIPSGMYSVQPFWINWFENITTIQFNHRMIAYLLALTVPLFWFMVTRYTQYKGLSIHLLLAALIGQICLGITTLLLSVPVALGASHQTGAVVLFTIALFVLRKLTQPVKAASEAQA
ncbi:MAG: heme A synthase [Gammaproteobacteria bacterium]|nr:MAG: heme A synthase [Gammaproteobacteria bacterium]